VNISGYPPEYLVDGPKVCVGHSQPVPGLRDQRIGDLRRWRPRPPGGP
jgi:hypothetical protein